jgi:hypothetical protein
MLPPVKIIFTISNRIRPKFMKTNLTAGLSALCAILLIVLLVLQTKQKSKLETLRQEHQAFASAMEQRQQEAHDAISKLADQVATLGTNLESRLVQGEQQANEKMDATLNMVQQNTAVMHRALGKVIPVELPEALTNQLAALEARIADENSWPKDSTNTDAMVAELRGLIRQIPPWAEEDYLPRLNALRWAVQSLELIQANVNALGEDLDAAADAYANQLSIQPDGGAANIVAALTSRQQDATARFAAFRRDSAIIDATNQLNLAVMDNGLMAWQTLGAWTNDPTQGQKVLELRRQLHARLLEDDMSKFIASVDAGLAQATNEPSLTIRQISFGKLLDGVVSQRQILLESPDAAASLSDGLKNLAARIEKAIKADGKSQEAEQETKSLDYQSWALSQIQKFNDTVNRAEGTRVPSGIYDSNNYAGIKNAMVKYLVPISVGFLDPAVSRLYYEAFDRGWKKLENQKYLQTEVAKQEAMIQKQKP